jgi:hypothetical protein
MRHQLVNAVGFWTLTLLAFAMFAVALLTPLIARNRALHEAERDLVAANARIEQRVQRLATATEQHRRHDPAVVLSNAQERLNYVPRTGSEIPVDRDTVVELDTDLAMNGRSDGSEQVGQADGTLLGRLWQRMGDRQFRIGMMAAAGVLFAIALFVFTGRPEDAEA